ncbi:MAG: HI0074 family nucleotidyltransferase substrate-binding subunit [Lachnospiraceae bacterium]|nr:HI0074 family nucleotidyltransferase substrate-binding subunit [Lachnospiraceae bacterium]
MEEKYFNRYKSLLKNFHNLTLSQNADPDNPFLIPGTVQNYNLTFDLSWKVMKELVTHEFGIIDFATDSPRETLRAAFSVKLISDDNWMQMLKVRNNLAHDYDGAIAERYFNDIIYKYIPLFKIFIEEISKYYPSVDSK